MKHCVRKILRTRKYFTYTKLPPNEKAINPAKHSVRKILRTQNCRGGFIKNLLPEKRKENMYTKQPRFKSRIKNI